VARAKATEDEWRVYYARADEMRTRVGDPLQRHIARETSRERLLLIGSSVFVLSLVSTAFYLLTR
jgi:type II secretory pathway component PulM